MSAPRTRGRGFTPRTRHTLSPADSRLQSVIFDMDGVIVNSHPAHRSAWKQFLHSVGKTVPEDDLDFILDGRKRNEILTYFFGPLCEQQLREYGDRKDAFFQAISPQDEAMPGVDELIIRLKEHRVPMAVATSAGASRTCSTLARLSL